MPVIRSCFAALVLLALPTAAIAARPALDPQNRLHAGVGVATGAGFSAPSVGATLGVDSRMSRVVYVDVGGFLSPVAVPDLGLAEEVGADSIFLRHGLYVAPGLRVPHRAGEGVTWDVLLRGGFAGVWWTDVQAEQTLGSGTYLVDLDPAALAGLDAIVRKGALGARVSAKGYIFAPYSHTQDEDIRVLRPHLAVEAFYQW